MPAEEECAVLEISGVTWTMTIGLIVVLLAVDFVLAHPPSAPAGGAVDREPGS